MRWGPAHFMFNYRFSPEISFRREKGVTSKLIAFSRDPNWLSPALGPCSQALKAPTRPDSKNESGFGHSPSHLQLMNLYLLTPNWPTVMLMIAELICDHREREGGQCLQDVPWTFNIAAQFFNRRHNKLGTRAWSKGSHILPMGIHHSVV